MVAEVRDGLLYIFMPPTEALEHFVDLIARVEAAAAKIDCPVVIEGYEPPPDPRLKSTTITPDPGVIEVNIAPTASFAEQSQQLETLYEQARLARLSTESFDVDGSHGGTGGGNHITLGGVTPQGLAAAAPPRPAGLAADLLAAPPVAVLPVRRAIRRHHVAGAAGRRGPRRGALRTRDRVRRNRPAHFEFRSAKARPNRG